MGELIDSLKALSDTWKIYLSAEIKFSPWKDDFEERNIFLNCNNKLVMISVPTEAIIDNICQSLLTSLSKKIKLSL